MNWKDWQTWAAFGAVVLAALLLGRSLLRRKKGGGCGGACSCPVKPTPARPPAPGSSAGSFRQSD